MKKVSLKILDSNLKIKIFSVITCSSLVRHRVAYIHCAIDGQLIDEVMESEGKQHIKNRTTSKTKKREKSISVVENYSNIYVSQIRRENKNRKK